MAATPTANNEAALPPEDWECCGSECGDACTFEIYRREKAEYEALKRQVQSDAPSGP